jgi:hypothetical protein
MPDDQFKDFTYSMQHLNFEIDIRLQKFSKFLKIFDTGAKKCGTSFADISSKP